MKIHSDENQFLTRGGKPTLADLLEKLTFSPAKGSIDLNGARMILSRATFGADLQDELIRRFGEREAMVLMLRLGYRNGREDAEFIRRAWPNLDIGDAFTAGTRLHMLTGTVRVETLHNDFDFKNDRFSGDFLWHGSVEATEYQRRHGRAMAPVCWAQTGYAAGYASVFFRKLILYKEVSCAAMGDKACRVVGKTVDDWGKDDPFVRMFLEEVLVTRAEMPSRTKTNAIARSHPATGVLQDLIVAPVRHELEQLAQARLSTVITGPAGSGRRTAAEWLHARRFPEGTIQHLSGQMPDLRPSLDAARQRGAKGHTLIIDRIEALSPDACDALMSLLREAEATPLLVVGISETPIDRMTTLPAALRYELGVLPIAMPSLAARRDDIAGISEMLLIKRDQTEGQVVKLSEAAKALLTQHDWPGNIHQLRHILRRAHLTAEGHRIEADNLASLLADDPAPVPAGSDIDALWTAITAFLDAGVGIDALTARVEELALAQANGNLSAAARRLGLTRAKLEYRLKSKPS